MQTFVTRGSHKYLWAEIVAHQLPESYDWDSSCKINWGNRNIAEIDLDWPKTMTVRGTFDYIDNPADPTGYPPDLSLRLDLADLKLLTQILKDCNDDDCGFEKNSKLWLDCEKETWKEPQTNHKDVTKGEPTQ